MGRPKGTRNSIKLSIKDKISLVEQCIEKVNNNAGSEDDSETSTWRNKVNITAFAAQRNILPRVLKKWISQYKLGQLKLVLNSENRIRIRKCPFQMVEDQLVQYVNLRLSSLHKEKCGLSWNILREEGKLIAEKCLSQEEAKTFQASVGWLRGVLERNGFIGISLHGEGNEYNNIDNGSSDCKEDIDEDVLSMKDASHETISLLERENEICSSQKKRKSGDAFDEDGSFGKSVCHLQHKAVRTSLINQCKKQKSMFDFLVPSATAPASKSSNEDISAPSFTDSHSLNNKSLVWRTDCTATQLSDVTEDSSLLSIRVSSK